VFGARTRRILQSSSQDVSDNYAALRAALAARTPSRFLLSLNGSSPKRGANRSPVSLTNEGRRESKPSFLSTLSRFGHQSRNVKIIIYDEI
jgi:hypothetical protein